MFSSQFLQRGGRSLFRRPTGSATTRARGPWEDPMTCRGPLRSRVHPPADSVPAFHRWDFTKSHRRDVGRRPAGRLATFHDTRKPPPPIIGHPFVSSPSDRTAPNPLGPPFPPNAHHHPPLGPSLLHHPHRDPLGTTCRGASGPSGARPPPAPTASSSKGTSTPGSTPCRGPLLAPLPPPLGLRGRGGGLRLLTKGGAALPLLPGVRKSDQERGRGPNVGR